jgi:HEAT repeat protein
MTKRIGMAVLLMVVVAISAHGDRLLGLGRDDTAIIEHELEKMGVASDLTSVLAAASSHHDPIVRFHAVRLLGYRPGTASEVVLRGQLADDPTRLVRAEAALALIRLGYVDAVEKAIELMVAAESPSTFQLSLAGQLAKLGEFSGYPYVVDAAVSEHQYLRFSSPAKLVSFLVAGFDAPPSQPSPQELLLKLLTDASAEVRGEVILQLSLGSAQVLDMQPYAQQIGRLAQDDPSPEVREEARRWLSTLAGKPQQDVD